MATITDTADKQCRAGRWHSVDFPYGDDGPERSIFHYETRMLTFNLDSSGQWDGNLDTVDYNLGHGSVSDQNGMNKLFARLGMPYYYQRQGSAQIVTLDGPAFRYRVSDKSKHGWKNNADLTWL